MVKSVQSIQSVMNLATEEVQSQGREFQQYLWAGIPISEKMRIEALPVSRTQFCLSAPLEPNRNVHGTAFAGSLYTVMSMAGWGLIRVELDRQLALLPPGYRADLWLTKASIRYLAPVDSQFSALAHTDDKALDSFWHKLVRKGRGKLCLPVQIGEPGKIQVTLQGEYAAKLIQLESF